MRVSTEDLAKLNPSGRVPKIVLITGGMLIVFFIAIPIIGTFPALIVFCPALATVWGERRWHLMALGFGIFIGFVYLLFRVVMNVPLP